MKYTDFGTTKKALNAWYLLAQSMPVQSSAAIIEHCDNIDQIADSMAVLLKELNNRSEGLLELKYGLGKVENDISKLAGLTKHFPTTKNYLPALVNDFGVLIFLVERFGDRLSSWAPDLELTDDCITEIRGILFQKNTLPEYLEFLLDLATHNEASQDIDLLNTAEMVV